MRQTGANFYKFLGLLRLRSMLNESMLCSLLAHTRTSYTHSRPIHLAQCDDMNFIMEFELNCERKKKKTSKKA